MAELHDKLQLTVVTRERRVLQESVDEVVLPGAEGALGILPGHTPLLSMLKIGVLTYRVGGREHQVALLWGFAEVLPDRVTVLAEGAYLADEIDAVAAEKQKAEAERELARLASHDDEFAAAEARLEESIAQISISSRTH